MEIRARFQLRRRMPGSYWVAILRVLGSFQEDEDADSILSVPKAGHALPEIHSLPPMLGDLFRILK